MNPTLFLIIAAAFAAANAKPQAPASLSRKPFRGRMVIFGDSLTDNGLDYDSDRHGFRVPTNGRTWGEYLARDLNLVDVCRRPKEPEIWAYSGANSGWGNYYFDDWSGNLWQIEEFLKQNNLEDGKEKTMFLWQLGGVNDLLEGDDSITVDQVVNNIMTGVQTLSDAGAQMLVLVDIFDISKAPGYLAEPYLSVASKVSSDITEANRRIRERVQQFGASGAEMRIMYIDWNEIWEAAKENFADSVGPFSYTRPDIVPSDVLAHAWFDSWHPTTAMMRHSAKAFADLMEEEIGHLMYTGSPRFPSVFPRVYSMLGYC